MDIRLQEERYKIDGKTYVLRCNMAVIADVQEAFGGSISAATGNRACLRSKLTFLAAMLNDYADEQGWPERYSWRQLGRRIHAGDAVLAQVGRLVVAEMYRPKDSTEPEAAGADNAKN